MFESLMYWISIDRKISEVIHQHSELPLIAIYHDEKWKSTALERIYNRYSTNLSCKKIQLTY
jgi:hypothetical protein